LFYEGPSKTTEVLEKAYLERTDKNIDKFMKDYAKEFKDCHFRLKPVRKIKNINKYIGKDGFPQVTDKCMLLTHREDDYRFFFDTEEVTDKIKQKLRTIEEMKMFTWMTFGSGFFAYTKTRGHFIHAETITTVQDNNVYLENKISKFRNLKLILNPKY
jgi:hypothetical protein